MKKFVFAGVAALMFCGAGQVLAAIDVDQYIDSAFAGNFKQALTP